MTPILEAMNDQVNSVSCYRVSEPDLQETGSPWGHLIWSPCQPWLEGRGASPLLTRSSQPNAKVLTGPRRDEKEPCSAKES